MANNEDIETPVEELDDTEVAAKALADAGDEVGSLKLRLERAERAVKRERDARQTIELSTYRAELATEFEYADPDLISGKTKKEMRASAERLHNAVAKIVEKKGLKPTPKTEAETEAETAAKKKGEWGAPPPVANEAVTGEAPMDWSEMQRAGLTGRDAQGRPMDRAAILADIKNNGAKRITRPSIGRVALRGRGEGSEPAKTA